MMFSSALTLIVIKRTKMTLKGNEMAVRAWSTIKGTQQNASSPPSCVAAIEKLPIVKDSMAERFSPLPWHKDARPVCRLLALWRGKKRPVRKLTSENVAWIGTAQRIFSTKPSYKLQFVLSKQASNVNNESSGSKPVQHQWEAKDQIRSTNSCANDKWKVTSFANAVGGRKWTKNIVFFVGFLKIKRSVRENHK